MRSKAFIIGILLIFGLIGVAGASQSIPITVDQNNLPADYPLKLIIHNTTGMTENYANIRFFANDTFENGGTNISYFIAQQNTSAAIVYTKLPEFTTEFYCEWELDGETASESNGTQVFSWYD